MVGATYTYLHTNDNQGISAPPGGNLFTTLTRSGGFFDASTAVAMTNLNYNVLDVDFSKRFSPAHSLDLTVFGGGCGAIIDQKFDVIYNGGTSGAVNDHVSSPVYFYGGGLTFGMESQWMIYEGHSPHTGLSLYARARGSLLTGEFRNFETETNANGTVVITNVYEKTQSVVPVAELAFGVAMEWEHLNVRVGYEITNWFDMVNSPSFTDAANIGNITRRTSDLSLEGLAVHLGLSF